jgi:hypothetical protein
MPREGRGIALLFPDLGARKGWVVNTMPRRLYPRERPGTHCTGGWVGPRTGLDGCEKSRPHRDFVCSQVLHSNSRANTKHLQIITASHFHSPKASPSRHPSISFVLLTSGFTIYTSHFSISTNPTLSPPLEIRSPDRPAVASRYTD